MVCIEKRPHKMRGRSLAPNFIYLTCLLDRGHITIIMQKNKSQAPKSLRFMVKFKYATT